MPLQENSSQFPLKSRRKIDSKIFSGKYFYIEGTQRKDLELQKTFLQITKNSGKCYDSRKNIESGICYYVLKDSPECTNLVKRLKSQVQRGEALIQPVSSRWIHDCIAKGRFIDIIQQASFIYKPFPFVCPIPGFHRFVFYVLMTDSVLRLRLKELYNVLGSIKNSPNKADITHCLCGDGYS